MAAHLRTRGRTRRNILRLTGSAATGLALAASTGAAAGDPAAAASRRATRSPRSGTLTMFLCGDVMLGRGIDQILPHAVDPTLHEAYVRSAVTYLELAERASGRIPRAVAPAYVWGDALETLRRLDPEVRIINLETSVTVSEDFDPKGINYRMHPANIGVLKVADIDCCVLANNHVLDWGRAGLLETLRTVEQAGIAVAGAGRDAMAAAAPAIIRQADALRVLVFAFGLASSGIPSAWAARPGVPGVNLLPDLSDETILEIAARVRTVRKPGDLLVASIHWGGNWGYEIPKDQITFAHGLIDQAGFDVIHGHSSHHAKAIEVHRGRPILYGAGDFINDYEGIEGHEEYRDDLAVMYLPRLAAPGGELVELPLEVFRIRQFRLHRASPEDTLWLRDTLARQSRRFGTRIERREENRLAVVWR